MPPNPDIPTVPPTRRFSSFSILQPVYLGLDVSVSESRDESHYSISVHDGSYTTDYYTGLLCKHTPGIGLEKCMEEAVTALKRVVKLYAVSQSYKVQLVACTYRLNELYLVKDPPVATTMSEFWRELDAIPFILKSDAKCSDERASAAVRKAVMLLSPQYPGNLPRVCVGYRHEVSRISLLSLNSPSDFFSLIGRRWVWLKNRSRGSVRLMHSVFVPSWLQQRHSYGRSGRLPKDSLWGNMEGLERYCWRIQKEKSQSNLLQLDAPRRRR